MGLLNYLLLAALLAQGPVCAEPNGLQCNVCPYPMTSCNETEITVHNCTGLEDHCVTTYFNFLIDSSRVSKTDFIHGGCTYHPSGTAPLGYQTDGIESLFEFCNSSLCNNATMGFLKEIETSNGVKCLSCEDVHTPGCSTQNETVIECIGPLSMCMNATAADGRRNVTVNIKGCATPAWCQRPIYKAYQTADFQQVHCCQGNLCNGQEVNAGTTAAWITSTSVQTKSSPKINKSGGSLVVGIPQITAAFLLIGTSWNLLMFPGF